MALFFKIFSIVFAVLFGVSAYVQLNDPDPYLWIAAYLFAALVSVLFYFKKLNFKMTLGIAIIYSIAALLSWPQIFEGVRIGGGDIQNIEEGREALGLVLCVVVFLVYAFRMRYVTKIK